MKTSILTAVVALLSTPVLAQTAPPPAPPAQTVELPEVPGATADPTCGGRAELARIAFCISSTQAGMQSVADAYSAEFAKQGWLVGAGDANLIVYVRRKPAGGCEAFQMQAFANDDRVPAPGAPAYLAFATIPGDICAAGTGAAPQ
jgi:hypothetical protein